jgi:recombinational DNA repair protein (RecF pathway)
MQLLSLGQAHIIISERRDLQILTAFDLQRLHVALARDMDRYAAASALAEVTMRFAPADPHPEIYQFLHLALAQLEEAPEHEVPALGIKLLWGLAGILGFAPSLEDCARDGAPVGAEGPMAFSAEDGGAPVRPLCRRAKVCPAPRIGSCGPRASALGRRSRTRRSMNATPQPTAGW